MVSAFEGRFSKIMPSQACHGRGSENKRQVGLDSQRQRKKKGWRFLPRPGTTLSRLVEAFAELCLAVAAARGRTPPPLVCPTNHASKYRLLETRCLPSTDPNKTKRRLEAAKLPGTLWGAQPTSGGRRRLELM